MSLAPIYMGLFSNTIVHPIGNLLTKLKLLPVVSSFPQSLLMVGEEYFPATRPVRVHIHQLRIPKTEGFVVGGTQEFRGFLVR